MGFETDENSLRFSIGGGLPHCQPPHLVHARGWPSCGAISCAFPAEGGLSASTSSLPTLSSFSCYRPWDIRCLDPILPFASLPCNHVISDARFFECGASAFGLTCRLTHTRSHFFVVQFTLLPFQHRGQQCGCGNFRLRPLPSPLWAPICVTAVPRCHVSMLRFAYLGGVRVGEAANPGPASSPSFFRLAIVNPTAIRNKEAELLSLQANVICAAETTAVLRVQQQFSRQMRRKSFHSVWGAPVSPLLAHDAQESSLRGLAGGVAIFSNCPTRSSIQPLPAAVFATTRIIECFTKIAALEVRLVCVYGLPQCHPNALETNDFLLKHAFDRVCLSNIPAIVAGDWNCDPTSLPTWANFAQLGYTEAFRVVRARLGLSLPPTCKGATYFDTALLAPTLVPLLHGASVLQQEHLFDAHSPFLLDFDIPCQLPCYHRWRMPKPWNDFSFSEADFASSYSSKAQNVEVALQSVSSQAAVESAFSTWAGEVEASVHEAVQAAALAHGGHQGQGLPRSHKGRCTPVRRVKRQVPQLPRPGRAGDFMVSTETPSIRVKWRVRQVRRVRTMLGGLRKFLSMESPCPTLLQQLLNEWAAIVRAKGFGSCFADWVLSWDFVGYFPTDFPTEPWLHDLHQLLQFDCQALAAQLSRQNSNKFKLAV